VFYAFRAQATSVSQGRSSPRRLRSSTRAKAAFRFRSTRPGGVRLADIAAALSSTGPSHPFALAGRAAHVDNHCAAMRVRVSDPALLGDLQRYLRSAECVAERSGEDTLDVSIPRAPSDEQARREVAIYLQT
jgi:hypothetical protein